MHQRSWILAAFRAWWTKTKTNETQGIKALTNNRMLDIELEEATQKWSFSYTAILKDKDTDLYTLEEARCELVLTNHRYCEAPERLQSILATKQARPWYQEHLGPLITAAATTLAAILAALIGGLFLLLSKTVPDAPNPSAEAVPSPITVETPSDPTPTTLPGMPHPGESPRPSLPAQRPTAPSIQQALADSAFQVTVSWTAATDEVGVTAYTLYRNGTPIGTTPALSYVDTGLAIATTYAYTVTALDAAGNESTPSATASVTTLAALDTLAPTVTLTAPAHGATLAGSVIVAATATDNVGVLGVQFQLDGANLGSEDTTNDYQVVWDTSTVGPGTYTLTAIARDAAGNSTTTAPITVTATDSPLPLEITNVTVTSGRDYQVIPNGLQPGAIAYGESYSSFAGRQDFSKIWQGFGLVTERENTDR